MRIRAVLLAWLLAACQSGGSVGDGGADLPDLSSDAPDLAGLPSSRYQPGRWPAPTTTFTLPTDKPLYYPDLQKSFPAVAWNVIDRLYIPAGKYGPVVLGNLPNRTPQMPLIITNLGGQVLIESTNGTARLELAGGANWALTARPDPAAGIGDAAFPGHWNADYAHSHRRYGIEIHQKFVTYSGIKVSAKATDFELEFMEVWETGFAGLLIKTDHDPDATMRNVAIHDMYIHDTDAEGMYIGNTTFNPDAEHRFENLKIFNNRVLRTGAETIQVSHISDGSEIYNNVCLGGAMDWKDPFMPLYQDGNLQVGARTGTVRIHHNIFSVAGTHLFTLRTFAGHGDVPSAGDSLQLEDNYFSHGRGQNTAYLFSESTNSVSSVHIERNRLRAMTFNLAEIQPTLLVSTFLLETKFMPNPLYVVDNTYDDSRDLVSFPSNLEGNTGNTMGTVAPPTFVDSGFAADFDYQRLERWSDCSQNYGNAPITYVAGDHVTFGGSLYRQLATAPAAYDCSKPYWEPCKGFAVGGVPTVYAVGDIVDTGLDVHYQLTATPATYLCSNSVELYANPQPREDLTHWTPIVFNANPAQDPTRWTEVGFPKDDVRLTSTSAQQGLGLLDVGP